MRRRILPLAVAVIVLGFAVFGLINRFTYTDITSEPGYLEYFQVAEISEEACLFTVSEMREALPQAPVIVRVRPTAEIEYMFSTARQSFVVTELIKGEGLSEGEEIYLISDRWRAIVREGQRFIERGFINFPELDSEYLAFISDEDVPQEGDLPVWKLDNCGLITPLFALEDRDNVIRPISGTSTYVPYSEVSGNEFFAVTQTALDAMLELKHEFIEAYC